MKKKESNLPQWVVVESFVAIGCFAKVAFIAEPSHRALMQNSPGAVGNRDMDHKLQLTVRLSAVCLYVLCRLQTPGTPTHSGNTRGVNGVWGGGFKAKGAPNSRSPDRCILFSAFSVSSTVGT